MKKIFFENKINILFCLISFFLLAFAIGVENIPFTNTAWLYAGESTYHQLGWHFFKNDVWRFPLGSNPNYGEDFGNSIVYTGTIPILALFFKLFKTFISGNFQFFSLWYFLCFYLQLYFSFKILKKFTNSDLYSLIGSIFFLIAPIFIYRINFHISLVSHWLLLFALYLGLTNEANKKKLLWIILIIISALIHFYFTAIIIAIYSLLRIFNFFSKKDNFLDLLKDFFIFSILLFLTLYIAGYFEVRMADTLGVGFGYYKLNLLSIFDSYNSSNGIAWSWFLPDIKLTPGEEIEGFNYFGLGQILMVFLAIILFFRNYKNNLTSIKNSHEIKAFFIMSLFLTIWALSNKISIGSITLIDIPLNKFILGGLSIVKSTGRVFWVVNYFILFLSIIIIFKSFNEKKALMIISVFLVIQTLDISSGIVKHIDFYKYKKQDVVFKDQIWDNLFKKYKIVKTTYPISWSGLFGNFSYLLEKYNVEKTNLVTLIRTNRKKIAESRYALYDNFTKKNLASDTVYVVDNYAHLRHLKYIFKDENVGFYFRDGIWLMVKDEKEGMNDNDKKIFEEIKPITLDFNQKKNFFFKEKDNYYGFGWSHNFSKPGIWSEGPKSTILFKTKSNFEGLRVEILCKPYITKKNKILEFDVYVNNIFNKNIKLQNNQEDRKIEILMNKEFIKDKDVKIDFKFKNLVSPYEVLESPDSRKLGILAKNIEIFPI